MSNNSYEEKFQVTICSPPDREGLVAEIYYKNCQWAEINQENGKLEVQFYPHSTNPYWEFDLEEALEMLAKAKQKLVAMGPKR